MKHLIAAALLVVSTLGATPAPQPKEEAVTVSIPGGSLSGTLMIPDGKGPVPVALIIAGSGPVDRNGNVGTEMTSNVYKKLAEALAAQGIATLRYDKRNIGESHVNQKETDLRLVDFVNDALAMAKSLESDPRFSSVSIVGHSEGSLIGMLAAQRDAHIHCFVSLEGAGRDFATLIDEQVRRNPADPPKIIQEVQSYNKQLAAGHTVTNTDALLAGLYNPQIQPFLISEFHYDPAHEIAKLKIPVMIVQGTHDVQITDVDARRLKEFDPSAKLVTIENMNHMLVDAPSDYFANIGTYGNAALPLKPALVNNVASFILAANR